MYRGGPPVQRPYMGDMSYSDQNRGPVSYDSGMSFPPHYGGSSNYGFASGLNSSFGGGAGASFGAGRGRGGFQGSSPSFGSPYGRSFSGGRRRDSSANSFRGGRNKRRGTAPSGPGVGPQAKKPVFNDPFSALIGYLGHKEKVNVDFTDLPPAADGSPQYESRVVLDGTSYTAEGSSKKEAKQKMAVIALRDKFGLDASELLQTYLLNLNQTMARRSALYGEAGGIGTGIENSGATKSEKRALRAAAASTGAEDGVTDAAMDVEPADYTEDFNPFLPTANAQNQFSSAKNNLTPISASVNGYNNAFPTSGGNLQPVKSRIGRPAVGRGVAASASLTTGSYNSRAAAAAAATSANDYFTSADVKHLLSENQRLKVENEMLRSQLGAAGVRSSVHSRLGAVWNDDEYDFGVGPLVAGSIPWMASLQNVVPFANPGAEFDRMFKQQPVVEASSGAYDELTEIRKANTEELSMHVKRCETVLISASGANGAADASAEPEKATFALIVVKHKITDDGKYRAYRFVGKGSNKTEAIASGATLAIPFVNRLLAGDKLIPLHTSYVSFLIEVMTRQGIEKASECIQTINLQDDEAKKSAPADTEVGAKVEMIGAEEIVSSEESPEGVEGGSQPQVSGDAKGNSSAPVMQTTIRVNELEIVQTGQTRSESRENAARKCLLDVYGYNTFTL